MTGLITLSENIYCKKEVLGKIFECKIEGIKASLLFPRYPEIDADNPAIGINNPLLPPQIGEKWKRGDENLSWGYPLSYPAGNSCVELLALSVDCEKEQVIAYAQKLYESIQKWEHAFIDYLKVITKQNTERDKNIKRNACRLELIENRNFPHNMTSTLYANIPAEDTYASIKNIMDAIEFADSGKEMFLEYQMLLSAYEARRLNQNRRAVLDACSAMEISLVKQITLYCHSIGLSPDILIDKYRYLGDRLNLIKKIDDGVPDENYKELVTEPRNAVMHNKDIFPSDETTDNLILCVERLLEHFFVSYS